MSQAVLYTYQYVEGQAPVCHFYAADDQAAAQAKGQELEAAFHADPATRIAEFTFMVGPLEAMPA